MENKRGISPLIATVLIIGFTIVLAVLVITWISGTVNTQTEDTDCMVDANNLCLAAVGDISGSISGTVLTIANEGSTDFSDVNVAYLDSTGATIGNIENIGALAAGITDTGTVPGTAVKARIIPSVTSSVGGGCTAECSPVEVMV